MDLTSEEMIKLRLIINQTEETNFIVTELRKDLDVMFLFLAGDIVMLLQAGFAFLECGVVRSKNTTNILIKNLLDLFISGIAFWLIGYGFAFGEGNQFIGTSHFASTGIEERAFANWFFQYVFASTASTIISGAVAERCDFVPYMVYSFGVSGFVYPVLVHWCWQPGGWLYRGSTVGGTNYHFVDYAGSGVVHMCGGVCSVVAACILGPRIGRFDPVTGEAREIKGHSMPLAALGGFILVFGIIAFNGGSQGHISEPGDGKFIAVMIANTVIAGSFGAITALVVDKMGIFGGNRQWSFLLSLNGSLVAMIATCSGGERMHTWVAAIVGIIAPFIFFIFRKILVKLRIDDPLDVVPVHFGGGLWGVIAGSLLSKSESALSGPGDMPVMWFVWNLIGACAIFVWAAGTSVIMFGSMKYLKVLRVSPEMELSGLDIPKHGESAYPASGWEEEQYANHGNEYNETLFGIHPIMAYYQKKLELNGDGPKNDNGARINPTFVPEIADSVSHF